MRQLLGLGAGTAGRMRRLLDPHQWQVTVVDRDDDHHYQPGYLFVPFAMMTPDDVALAPRPAARRVEDILSASDFIKRTDGAQLLFI